MILGMSVSSFTFLHVVLSLVGLTTGFVVVLRMIRSQRTSSLTTLFLFATTATSVTGFLFPITRVGLGQVIGALSLAVLAPTIIALYGYRLAGPWRAVYATGATAALYLNVVIAVAQAFAKIPALQDLAPSRSAPVFIATQVAVLAIFAGLGILAARRSRPCTPSLVRIRLPPAPV